VIWSRNSFTELLELAYPIVQAPLANISRAPLAGAVAEAGGLGCIGSAVFGPDELRTEVRALRELTSRCFGLNFFVHAAPRRNDEREGRMRQRLESYRVELGAADFPPLGGPPPFDDAMLEVVLELKPPVVSFHFGVPEPAAGAALHAAGIRIFASATTVAEARALEDWGVDAVIAQGFEAGGHRATFAAGFSEGEIGLMALLPQIVDAVGVPVIAAGGIADGRGIAAALMLGASAVQLGTAFLGCPEATLDPLYRRVLGEPRAARTRVTTLLSGRPARAIVTRFMDEMREHEGQAAEFPLQRSFTGWLAKAAASRSDPEFSSLWAGQAAPLLRRLPAADLVATLARETDAALARAPHVPVR
jgi:nitronate monooxygenase